MKYLSKYTKFNESSGESLEEIERQKILPELLDIIADFIDDGYTIILSSTFDKINVNKYLNNDEDISKFNPVYKAGNKVISYFKLTILNKSPKTSKPQEYSNFAKLVNEMSVVVDRITDLDWELKDFKFNSDRLNPLEYSFNKPNIITEDELPTVDDIKSQFKEFGMEVEDVEYDDGICYVGADSLAYDGEIPNDIDDKLDRMLNIFGFDYYEKEVSIGNTWLSVKFWINPSV